MEKLEQVIKEKGIIGIDELMQENIKSSYMIQIGDDDFIYFTKNDKSYEDDSVYSVNMICCDNTDLMDIDGGFLNYIEVDRGEWQTMEKLHRVSEYNAYYGFYVSEYDSIHEIGSLGNCMKYLAQIETSF